MLSPISKEEKNYAFYSAGRFYFDDPRLKMTVAGRMFIRTAAYVAYLFLAAAGLISIFSDLVWLKAWGVFITLFLIDRIIHRDEADKHLDEISPSEKVNLDFYLSPASFSILETAFDKTKITKSNFFLRLARESLNQEQIKEGFSRLDVKPEEVVHKLEEFLQEPAPPADCRSQAETLVVKAGEIAIVSRRRFISAADMFSALFFVGDEFLERLFNMFSLKPGDVSKALIFSAPKRKLPLSLGGFRFETHRRLRHRIMNRAWTARPTPTLDRYSEDLTDLAREGYVGFLIGHESEYQRMVDALSKPASPNVLLVGEAGAGKEAIAANLAFNIVKDNVPAALFDKRLVALNISSFVAGATPEELHYRLQKIVSEIFIAGNVILYISDIHNLVRTSGQAYISAADALLPIIKNDAFPVIGATYPREYREFIEPRSDFAESFEVINVQEVSEGEAEEILAYDSLLLEKKTGVAVSFGAAKTAVKLAKKYFHQKLLPGSAEEILRGAVAITQRAGKKMAGREEIIEAAEEKTNVPIHEAGAGEAEALLNLENEIHKKLVDQEEAVKAVSAALREYRSGLSRPGGPIASFLFVGPTGAGKTELAKILSRINFGSEKAMLRFDMTEYQDKQSFQRFIGSPDGAIKGEMTEAVFQKPYSLILLDEFEKAFPDIWNLFLQVFDDGRLTDTLGRVIDFQNTIVIATSNAHSDIIGESLAKGESMDNIADYLKKRLIDVFKPELLNRFSKIIVFKDLSPDDTRRIAAINLGELAEILGGQGVKMSFDESAAALLAKLGYDPSFGARPLRRVVEEKIRAPLAEKILRKEIGRGSNVALSAAGEEFTFS